MEKWSVYKGFLFVGVTGVLLYALIARLVARLRRMSEALGKSEAKYRLLVENSPDAICINRDNKIVFANAAAVRLFGARDESQLLGKSPFDIIHPDFQEAARSRITKVLEEGCPIPLYEEKIVRLDGGILDVEAAKVSIVDQDGPAIKIILRDISERLRKDAEISRLNRLYAVLSQVNQMMACVNSREELFSGVCRVICEVGKFKLAWIGWLAAEGREVAPLAWHGVGEEIKQTIPLSPAHDPKASCGLVGTAICEARTCVVNDYVGNPSTHLWLEEAAAAGHRSAIALPLCNSGKIGGVLTVYAGEKNCFQTQEVKLLEEVAAGVSFALDHLDQETLRREAEEDLRKSAEQLRQLSRAVEQSPSSVVITDTLGNIQYVNPKFTEITGYTAAEAMG